MTAHVAMSIDTATRIESHFVDGSAPPIGVVNFDHDVAIYIYSEDTRRRLLAAIEAIHLLAVTEGEARAMDGNR
jgi:hypothetical protein